ncbi:hypothetical protein HZS_7033 [Henneguya salminicola]|nr:hypothetical protein HZS_7033 [Henneguya salminicola]
MNSERLHLQSTDTIIVEPIKQFYQTFLDEVYISYLFSKEVLYAAPIWVSYKKTFFSDRGENWRSAQIFLRTAPRFIKEHFFQKNKLSVNGI